MDPSGFGDRLRRLREAKGWSQEELARQAGSVTQAQVSRLESGQRANPKATVLLALARALQVSVDELLREEEGEGAR